MKQLIFLVLTILLLTSCQDVIDVELQETETRLVVNGLIRVDMSQEFAPIQIKVSETTNFFNDNVPTSLDDNATIIYGRFNPDSPENLELDPNNFSSSLTELEPGSGIYVPDLSFDADQRIRTSNIFPNTVFILFLEHKGRRYAARTPFSPTVPIDTITQGVNTLFGEDDIELKITITDVLDSEDFYVFDFGNGDFLTLEDEFIDGQEFEFSYFPERDISSGESLEVSILGADQDFFNYMDLLVEQTLNDGGIFETPAATVRGNVFDVTGLDNDILFDNVNRPDNFPLGYFAVVQEFKETIDVN
ncbi:Hypothetical protein I595_613 [Croceitalea dokdonensis DOKDO 023]|uniref:Lipoprotein n=1 Tax=Croceitalea dokdonensis DOKDO 023 TaxID=1300341 RepID=A0A0P7AZK6_9FLAO|nr:DUF4249 family protein [Croceitalea dokdonensis]KPM33707.1 Hypothetical protein I595_613 [Croceitalea dokdonensis DOKDO 023]